MVVAALRVTRVPVSLTFPAAAGLILLPQVFLALIGGWLSASVVSKVKRSVRVT